MSEIGSERLIPAVSASDVVDTTGAGDVFVGTVAAFFADGADLGEAVTMAAKASSDAVAWQGARAPF